MTSLKETHEAKLQELILLDKETMHLDVKPVDYSKCGMFTVSKGFFDFKKSKISDEDYEYHLENIEDQRSFLQSQLDELPEELAYLDEIEERIISRELRGE